MRASSALVLVLLAASATPAMAMELLVPAYFEATAAGNPWVQLAAAAPRVPVVAILNPSSGPGSSANAGYVGAVANLHAAGGQVVGYVSTAYGARPIAQVKADVDRYRAFYNIDGIFFDELATSSSASTLNYYGQLYNYVRQQDARLRVIGNPGTNTTVAHYNAPTADTFVIFESNAGYESWSPNAFVSSFPAWRSSNLLYEVSGVAQMQSRVALARSRGIGSVYITDDTAIDQNPWDTLPSYWNSLVDATRSSSAVWNRSGSGSWNDNASWSNAAVPAGGNADVGFMGSITGPRTVLIDDPASAGRLRFASPHRYVLSGSSSLELLAIAGAAEIDVTLGSHVVNVPLRLSSDLRINLSAGTELSIRDPLFTQEHTITKVGPGALRFESTVSDDAPVNVTMAGGSLVLAGGAELGRLNLISGVLQCDGAAAVSVNSLNLTSGAAIEIGVATMTLGGADIDAARSLLRSGAIRMLMPDSNRAVAVMSERGGVVLQTALIGDADLSGTTDFADLLTIGQSYGLTGTGIDWRNGDFTLDGRVDLADLQLAAHAWPWPLSDREMATLGAFASGALVRDLQRMMSVPEPAVVVSGTVLLLLLGRRRVRAPLSLSL